MKDAYYFSHDCNARNDPKCSALINDLGMEGYGFYWGLIEIISEQDGYKLLKFPKVYEGIAKQLNSNAEAVLKHIQALVKDYNLLSEDENYIWSETLLRRMKQREEKRKARAEAGRKGGLKTAAKKVNNDIDFKQCLSNAQADDNQSLSSAQPIKGKERKGNKNIYGHDFEIFWSIYQNKKDKAKAFRCWNTRIKEGYTAEQLIKAAENYMAECKKNHTETKFIKRGATFLGPDKPFEEYLEASEEQDATAQTLDYYKKMG